MSLSSGSFTLQKNKLSPGEFSRQFITIKIRSVRPGVKVSLSHYCREDAHLGSESLLENAALTTDYN